MLCEFGQPSLVVEVGGETLFDLYGIEKQSDQFNHSEIWKGPPAIVALFLLETINGFLSNFTTCRFRTEFVASAAEVCDPPASMKIGLRWTGQWMLLQTR